MGDNMKSISRRAFTLGFTGAALGLPLASAFAADDFDSGQAEWQQKFDGDARLRVPRSETPLLSQQTISGTEQAIAQYQALAGRGGWQTVPSNATLKIGSRGPAVVSLRQRLIITGDLDQQAGDSPVFDSYVEAGVRRFQARHGIGQTGIVAKQTFTEMNVPIQTRIRQLETNLVRLRAFSGNLGNRYVMLNIPAAAVETVENGQIATHHQAGVGKIDRQSPVMQARALSVNFNPFWTVPASIIRKDLIPKMQQDANYLTENKIRIFTRQGQELQPSQVNWNSNEATNYMFRQDPGGEINSLGFVRIDIANPHGVYMHDTPAKGIFGDDYRFVSSGCVRVQNVRDYVAWLLKDNPGWDRPKIDEAIRSGQRIDVRLTPAVNVYWVYITAWANENLIQFRDDIYRRDGFGGGAVAQSAPINNANAADDDLLPPIR
ncbi:murein L,D-transpeptidase YcbB/YkuD [Beijerinckia sp. GAS462]|nr:murein L,D-transpeptidase YcbB/YkuD [Beijerinckia sp. GAS462]SEB71725.1 Putative peptidoglycan binding domain-containing protein [Beijerinckia sp. 28-YEA-48]